jgi:hypothetical protein
MVVVDPVAVCPHPEPEGCVCPFVADPFGGPSEVPGVFVVPDGEFAPVVTDPFGGPSDVPGFFVVPGGKYAPVVGVTFG